MNNCFDEGTLQAWFDGELAANEAAKVAAHLNECLDCAAAAGAVEAENLMLSEGLAAEFAAPVPTERLRQRIDAAVAGFNRAPASSARRSSWSVLTEFFASFRPLAYASVVAMILVAAIVGFVYFRNQKPTSIANSNRQPPVVTRAPQQAAEQVAQHPTEEVSNPVLPSRPKITSVAYGKKTKSPAKAPEPDATSLSWQEQQYQYAIARLDEAIKIQPPLRPALQVEYEYNMALIDNAITTGRDVAKKKPKDPQAAQSVLTAYQNKIDLMNQIADAR